MGNPILNFPFKNKLKFGENVNKKLAIFWSKKGPNTKLKRIFAETIQEASIKNRDDPVAMAVTPRPKGGFFTAAPPVGFLPKRFSVPGVFGDNRGRKIRLGPTYTCPEGFE